jgi:hypothetical protein
MAPMMGSVDMSQEAYDRLRFLMKLTPKLQAEGWRDLETAPKDGSEVDLRVVHVNAAYSNDPVDDGWIAACRGHWTDFNGGGWVWRSLCGSICQWRPASSSHRSPTLPERG